MKKLILVLGAILSIMMAVVSPAAAQSSQEMQDMGIVSGYLRAFGDAEALQSGTPAADGSPSMMMVGIITFESKDKIDGHLDDFVTGFSDSFFVKGYEVEDQKNLGDEAKLVTGTADISGTKMPANAVLAQKDERVVIAISLGNEDTKASEDAAAFMVDAKPSDAEVVFDKNGKSTGGEFDMMPTTKDVKGMETMEAILDMDFMDMVKGTPQA